MGHLTPPNNSTMHCVLDWLGRSVVALLMTVGVLYASAYTLGWPNLPDPDKQWRKDRGLHVPDRCHRHREGE